MTNRFLWLAAILVVGVVALALFQTRRGPDASQWFAREVDQDLVEAAVRGDTAGIDAAIAEGADVNAVGTKGIHPLDVAYQMYPNKAAFRRLLEQGADPNLANDSAQCIMNYAASDREDPEWLRMSLEHGGDPNVRSVAGNTNRPEGTTPVWDAIHSNNVTNLEMLVASGADINVVDHINGYSPLLFASTSRLPEMAKWLLEHGADWTVQIEGGIGLAEMEIRHEYDAKEFPEAAEAHEWILNYLEDEGVDLGAAEQRSREFYGENFRPYEH